MLQLVNATPFAVHRGVLLSPQGAQLWTVCIKGTYQLRADGSLRLHRQQEPVALYPLYRGEPGRSSLLREAEFVCDHPGTAVTLNATAIVPDGKHARQIEVSARVGPLSHRLRVVGDRVWQSKGRMRIPQASEPKPFQSMPICWERALGGTDLASGKVSARNPVGVGWSATAQPTEGSALPNIEHGEAAPQPEGDAYTPAGFGAIASAWSPRRELAGTADEVWASTRAPLWPEDWNPWYHNAAPPPLQSSTKLRGGEAVELVHLASAPLLSFRLPRVFFDLRTTFAGQSLAGEVGLDRVIIEPDAARLIMVWRSSLDCGPDARRVAQSWLDTKTDLRTGRKDGLA